MNDDLTFMKHRLEMPYNRWSVPAFSSPPVIALCEGREEVAHLSQRPDLKIDFLVALTPQAASQCHLMGLPYSKIEDFFDVSAFGDLDEPMLALQGLWSDKTDAFLEQAYPPFQELSFRPAGQYFFFLKNILDMLFKVVFGLAHLFLCQPRPLIYFAKEGRDEGLDQTLFFDASTLYSLCLPLCAKAYDIPTEPLPFRVSKNLSKNSKDKGFRSLMRRMLPSSIVETIRKATRWKFVPDSRDSDHRAPSYLVYGYGYDVNHVVKILEEKGTRCVSFRDMVKRSHSDTEQDRSLYAALPRIWRQLRYEPFFKEPFQWMGIDLWPIAESRMHFWLHSRVPMMWQTFLNVRQHFKRHRPEAVLTYSPWSGEDHAVLQAARSLKIPTVTYQHGGFEGNCEYTTYDMTDLRQSDYRMVYGEGTATYFRGRSQRFRDRAQIIPVGSARLDALRSLPDQRAEIRRQMGIGTSEKVVLYLPTSYQYNWYMARQSYFGVPYFQLLLKVIAVIKEFGRLRFIYKPFPESPSDPIPQVLESEMPTCKIATRISVPHLMQASDAFVMDIPSTGLLEACLTAKPMLVFADQRLIRLLPEARELLKKRAVLSESVDDYLTQLGIFLDRGCFQDFKNTDDGFLTAYGTYQNDGRSMQRVSDALQEIIRTHALKNFKAEATGAKFETCSL